MKIEGRKGLAGAALVEHLSIPEPMSGCWLWLGTTRSNRPGSHLEMVYGCVSVSGRYLRAHRYAYEVFKGAIPDGLLVRHTCDNTLCVNPDHLVSGTPLDNAADMARRGRNKFSSGEKNGKSKISTEQAANVRWLLAQGIRHQPIATQTGVPLSTVRSISFGKVWGWVTPIPPTVHGENA